MKKTLVSLLASGSIAGAAAAGTDSADDSRVADLESQVAALRAELDQVKIKTSTDWLTEQRSAEIKDLVYDVLADADTRASMLQSGMTAGWDKGFFLASSDGAYTLKFSGQVQIRFTYNTAEDRSAISGDEHRWGLENRRTKLKFKGTVLDPTWQWGVTGAFDREGGLFELEDAFVKKDFENGWALKFGQFKAAFMLEETISSTRQLAVDRSLVNEKWNQGFSQQIELQYAAEQIRAYFGIGDGISNTPFGGGVNTRWETEDTELAVYGRVEALLAGNWNQYKEFTSKRGSEKFFAVGAAAMYETDEDGTPSVSNEELFRATADVMFKGDGFGLFAAVVYSSLEEADLDQYGFVVQGGYYLTDDFEVFARYEWADADIAGSEDLSVITLGFNRYWAGHALKWTTDVGYGFNEVTGEFDRSSVGWLEDATDEDGQFVFRTQFQLLF